MSKQILSYREEVERMKMRRIAEMRELRKTCTLAEIAKMYGFKDRRNVAYWLGKTGRNKRAKKVASQ